MGKFTVNGSEKGEAYCSAIEMKTTFCAQSETTARAVEKVMEQSETFLKMLDRAGFKIEDIRVEKSSLEKDADDILATVERKLKIKMSFDMREICGQTCREVPMDSGNESGIVVKFLNQKTIDIDSITGKKD